MARIENVNSRPVFLLCCPEPIYVLVKMEKYAIQVDGGSDVVVVKSRSGQDIARGQSNLAAGNTPTGADKMATA